MKVLSVINNDKDAVTKEYVDSKAGVTAVDPTSGPVETDFFIPTKTSELTNDSGFITEAALVTKQDALVSGTNIKTINNQTLLGSGNITISSGVTSYNDLTDKPFYDASYLLRAVGNSLTQEKFEELLETIESNTVIKIGNSIVFAIADLLPQIVISWVNYNQLFMISILGEYNNHPVTYEYNGKELAFADDIPDFFIDGNFLIQSMGSTITNEQYRILEDGIERKVAIIEGATGHISEREKDNTYYIVISYLTDNAINEIWVSETKNNHQVTAEHKRLATTSDLAIKQDTLVSGTNIKTINSQSLLGSGDITVGGGTATDVKINGISITSNDEADIQTQGTYNANTNKIATMTDVSNAVASKLDGNWNADDSNGSIEWQEGESPTASKLITKVASNTNNNFSQTEITSDNMLLTSGVNGVQMNTSINMTPSAINITNQTIDGSITIKADLITLNGGAQIATVPDTKNSIVNKKYVDDIVGDIESLLGGI